MYIVYEKATGKILAVYAYEKGTVSPSRLAKENCDILEVPNARMDFKGKIIREGQIVDVKPKTSQFTFAPNKFINILLFSDAPHLPTGFGSQIDYLLKGFNSSKQFRAECIDWKQLETIQARKFDVLITLSDIHLIQKIKSMNIKNWYAWTVVDSDPPYPDSFWSKLKDIPHIVALTKATQSQIPNSHYIPHGIDLDVCKILPTSTIEKYKENNDLSHNFVIGYLGTNTVRKQIPKLIEAFNIFSKDKSNVRLCLKTKDEGMYFLSLILENLECRDKIKIYENDFSPEGLNVWMNLCDIAASATTAEGFGIPTIQFSALNIPMVIGDHTGSKELTNNSLPLVRGTYLKNEEGYNYFDIDIEDMSNKFEYYYKRWQEGDLNLQLREFIKSEYDIKKIVKDWMNLIQ